MKKLKLNLKPTIKKFELSARKNTLSELSGKYLSLFKGKGLEFAGYRTYTYADDSEEIDWKASLRAGETLVKLMEEERNTKVYFLFDVGNSMLFASTNQLKCEYGAEVIASICFEILKAGDNAELIMFSDKINKIVPSRTGAEQYYRIVKELSNPLNYGGNFDFTQILKYVDGYIPENSIIIIVSDFIGLDNNWMTYFRIAAKRFDLVFAIMIRDPVDNNMPEDTGQIALEDPYSKTKLLVDPDGVSDSYAQRSYSIKQKIKEELLKCGCDTLELVTNKSFERELSKFFVRSMRKWR
jgi:uncharacterized protein (DUF58 family)